MCEQTIAEYEAEIAAIDAKLAQLRTSNNWMENARYNQLSCMRGDLCLQLHAACISENRGRPLDEASRN
ncbi:hypothetical protein [Anaeromassilibacillus senegalensis]|uniref:hypothetical protein n=1 Tax=Anaeromassilibacillus senegalensis TaxID=1673717 RepID=UPI000682A506|nr:hypothetical protein [Anaeromassilibacillus senegalensis]